jgi:hypothetical protein
LPRPRTSDITSERFFFVQISVISRKARTRSLGFQVCRDFFQDLIS